LRKKDSIEGSPKKEAGELLKTADKNLPLNVPQGNSGVENRKMNKNPPPKT